MNKKVIPAICLVAALALGTTACGGGGDAQDDPRKVGANDALIWCVDGSEQVLQNTAYEDFAREKSNAVALSAVRNEYETANIIVSAKKDLAFEVSVSDLVLEGDALKKIGKENVTVYTQKYMAVGKTWHGGAAVSGGYPDALVPQENAIKYQVNYVDEGKNGAAFLAFYIPKDAAAGSYTGTATVNLGKESVSVPVSLTVYDYTLSDETHSKTIFTVNQPNVFINERDNRMSIIDKYSEFMLDYRIAPNIGFVENSDTAVEVFTEKAYQYAMKGSSTIALPSMGVDRGGYNVIDADYSAEFVVALAEKSVETGINLIDRCSFFNFWIDEPFCSNYPDTAVDASISAFNGMLDLSVLNFRNTAAYKEATGEKRELADEIVESIGKISNVITDYYDDDHNLVHTGAAVNTDYDGKNVTVCPKPDGYENADYRALYNTSFDDGTPREKWIYGCNTPGYPYVSYHLDDTLVSPTAFGWMMAQYNVTGNLYWSCVYWYNGETGEYLEDPYSSSDHGAGALGDGVLLYPGKPYGVDGPIGCTRLQAIRDGQEDYELFYALRQAYEKEGKNADEVIDFVAKNVTENGALVGDCSDYASARKMLIDLVLAADSKASLKVDDVSIEENADGMKEYTFTVSVAEGATVKENGTTLTAENGIYIVKKQLTETKNYVRLEAMKDGETVSVEFYLGGKQEMFGADGFGSSDINANGALTSAYDAASGEWQITYSQPEREGVLHSFDWLHKTVAQIDANTAGYHIFLHNYGNAGKYNVYAQYENSATFFTVDTGTLESGVNEIVLTAFASNRGKVKQLIFEFDGEIVKVGIVRVVVYGG